MLFNSVQFVLFFILTTVLYYLLPQRFRWILLLTMSCLFYMAFIPIYILVLALAIIVDYIAALIVEKAQGHKRKMFLVVSIVFNCALLFIFKYFNFFNASFASIASFLHRHYSPPVLNLILPLGLSFHTFQSLGYVIDVYRGRQKAERHLGVYALYIMFFPQLVAGPIERAGSLIPQIKEKHFFNYLRVTDGLKLMAWGFFKKMVIADHLAVFVENVYADIPSYSGGSLILATVFFAFQIYCDFSGYSDIAIGSARVLGFTLRKNFNRPYFSRSFSEFWSRWHISLSTWFRDYFYIPLGGNRVPTSRLYFNLFITFLISGLWHGAAGVFLVWGAIHGFYIVLERSTDKIRTKLAKQLGLGLCPWFCEALRWGTTFGLTCLAWIFFRVKTLAEAKYILTHLFSPGRSLLTADTALDFNIGMVSLLFLIIIEAVQEKIDIKRSLSLQPGWLRWLAYNGLLASVIIFGKYYFKQFIYFQF